MVIIDHHDLKSFLTTTILSRRQVHWARIRLGLVRRLARVREGALTLSCRLVPVNNTLNRDPSVTDEQLADYLKLRAEAEEKGKEVAAASGSGAYGATGSALGKRKTSGLYGATDRGLIGIVSKIGAEYLNSYKGHDDTADDGWLHHKIDWIQSGRETDTDIIERE
ncbi:hypothetical protein BDR22DRAFT_826625 [Usnea florida]